MTRETWPTSATSRFSTGRSAAFRRSPRGFPTSRSSPGIFQTFYLGYGAGGPAFFWTWPLVFLGQGAVALCFAELAARYPLSGGVYQWSRRLSSRGFGWMAGWVYLCGAVISLAAVALALQATLPQIAPVFQLIGDPADRASAAANAVASGLRLDRGLDSDQLGRRAASRPDQQRWRDRRARGCGDLDRAAGGEHSPRAGDLVRLDGERTTKELSVTSVPFLAAALMASYVMYGFDTAGALAEETGEPRRRAPWAILQALAAAALAGGLLILFGILAVSDPGLPELGRISGGLPFLVKNVLGEKLGVLLLVEVIFAVFVCALAVHAAAVRLMFAMARDNNLPFAVALSHVSPRSRTPVVPSLVVGALAGAILVANVNLPNVIEMLCSIAIVWANLAYLMVTFPLLLSRRKRPRGRSAASTDGTRILANGFRWHSRSAAPPIFRSGDLAFRSTWSRSSGVSSSSPTSVGRAPRFTATIPGAASPPRWRPSR